MKKLILSSIALCSALSFAGAIQPTRVGPVSAYGELITGKNSSGYGRIYGSCKGVKDGAEVQVRGMSLYWSLLSDATDFWTEQAISSMVSSMKIQIIRAAMAAGTEDWSGPYRGYQVDAENQKRLVRTVVEAAIKNDIYVIIDWHSHEAHSQTASAKGFFSEMAQTYGQYDNVIFEVYNEPTNVEWNTVKNYANEIIGEIRKYSDNLILVGTPKWDQNPQQAINNEVTDPNKNTAYTLHYYANSHCWSGSNDYGEACEGEKGLSAMKAGLSLFVSEWGTANSDGKGSPDQGRNQSWQNYLNQHKLSWANWSASKINEGTAAFSSGATPSNLQYSTSGNMVKGFLATNPTAYTACSDVKPIVPVNPIDTSSAIFPEMQPQNWNVEVHGKMLNVTGGLANVGVYDMQGRQLLRKANVSTLSLESFIPGRYVLQAQKGLETVVRAFRVR